MGGVITLGGLWGTTLINVTNIHTSMVKHIHIIVDDEDYEKLMQAKKGKTWRVFLFENVDKDG